MREIVEYLRRCKRFFKIKKIHTEEEEEKEEVDEG